MDLCNLLDHARTQMNAATTSAIERSWRLVLEGATNLEAYGLAGEKVEVLDDPPKVAPSGADRVRLYFRRIWRALWGLDEA